MVAKKRKRFDRVVAVDLGNGMVKIRSKSLETGLEYVVNLPTAWAYKRDVASSIHNETLELDTFEINDVEYVWGKDIADVPNIKIAYGHDNRYKSDAYRIMVKIALAKVAHDLKIEPTEKVYLVTGVPSEETNTSKEDEIVEAFMGDNNGIHEVGVNESEHMIKIAHVEVLSQPVATVLGRYLDEDGYEADAEYADLKVAVIDIGGGTTDLDVVHRLQRMQGYSSIPKGFRDVYEYIRKEIQSVHPSHKIHDYKIFKHLDKKTYKPSKRATEVDFEDAMDKGLDEVAVDIQTEIMNKWRDLTDIDEILLIGASAKLFQDRLAKVITGITIPANHDISNVEGYYRWGMLRVGDEL
jgi:plasmid segregation protein ParM